ncbi:hypothetical protein O9993_18995 [Vibrio lentus]|nr:hypothetical protein [Vibrio lentus]
MWRRQVGEREASGSTDTISSNTVDASSAFNSSNEDDISSDKCSSDAIYTMADVVDTRRLDYSSIERLISTLTSAAFPTARSPVHGLWRRFSWG